MAASADARAEQRRVVLVVDDDAGMREAFHLILDDEYTVLDAAHGRTALAMISAQRVDLVILDILMPDVDGLEVLQELKAREPDLPVIMVTAVKTVRTTVAAMKLGAVDYITKPFLEEELRATVHRALEPRTGRRGPSPDRDDRAPQLSRTHRLLLVGGHPGWRATLAVALARVASVETAVALVDGLNRLLRFRPTCVVLNVGSSDEVGRFLRAHSVQLPACPVLVVSDDVYLDAGPAWETLNVRGVLPPPITSGALVSHIGDVLPPGGRLNAPWPKLGDSVSRTIDYLGRHFHEDLTVEGIAAIVDVSSSHLSHLFRAEIGLGVREFLTHVRVAIAQDLLAHTDEKLDAVAARVGFVDTSHLAHVFQRISGRPPSAYRRSAS